MSRSDSLLRFFVWELRLTLACEDTQCNFKVLASASLSFRSRKFSSTYRSEVISEFSETIIGDFSIESISRKDVRNVLARLAMFIFFPLEVRLSHQITACHRQTSNLRCPRLHNSKAEVALESYFWPMLALNGSRLEDRFLLCHFGIVTLWIVAPPP